MSLPDTTAGSGSGVRFHASGGSVSPTRGGADRFARDGTALADHDTATAKGGIEPEHARSLTAPSAPTAGTERGRGLTHHPPAVVSARAASAFASDAVRDADVGEPVGPSVRHRPRWGAASDRPDRV